MLWRNLRKEELSYVLWLVEGFSVYYIFVFDFNTDVDILRIAVQIEVIA